MRRLILLTLLGSSIALFLACGEDDSAVTPPTGDDAGSSGSSGTSGTSGSPDADAGADASSGGPQIPAECATVAEGMCDYFSRCAKLLVGLAYGDLETCKARFGLACARARQAPGAGPVNAACGTELKAKACTGSPSALPASCLVTGTLANDAVCEHDGQCQSTSCVKVGETCGKCAPRSAENGDCTNGVACELGLVCVAGSCKTAAAKNAACTGAGQCELPLRCIGGVCADPIGESTACTMPAGAEDPCDPTAGLYCKRTVAQPTQGTCEKLTFAAANAACGLINGELVLCGGKASCEGSGASRSCIPRAAEGASCDADGGPQCAAPAECTSATCTIPDPARCK